MPVVSRGHHREKAPHYRQHRNSEEDKTGLAWPGLAWPDKTQHGTAAGSIHHRSSCRHRRAPLHCHKDGNMHTDSWGGHMTICIKSHGGQIRWQGCHITKLLVLVLHAEYDSHKQKKQKKRGNAPKSPYCALFLNISLTYILENRK